MPTLSRARRKRVDYKKLPVWLQWVLPFGVGAVLVIALVVWVHHETNDVPSEAAISNKALAAENQQADAVMRQQQAPHTAVISAGATPAKGLEHAITVWLNGQIKTGKMNGPLTGGRCTVTGGSSAARVALKCTMLTANVNYPFYGVVQPSKRVMTFCQRIVYPAVYGMKEIPLSKRCLGAAAV